MKKGRNFRPFFLLGISVIVEIPLTCLFFRLTCVVVVLRLLAG